MTTEEINEKDCGCEGLRLTEAIHRLVQVTPEQRKTTSNGCNSPLPSVDSLRKIVSLIKDIVFPGYFDKRPAVDELRAYYIGTNVEQVVSLLKTQIACGLVYGTDRPEDEVRRQAEEMTIEFIESLPEIKRLLYTDVEAMVHNDPAVKSSGEVIFCYPLVDVMVHYRVAHCLLTMGVPVIPRIITELAHSRTGIDIHPGAQISDHFCIDHGTGIVIGETCIIGSHVMLYQGVTLCAKSFTYGADGVPLNVPRHPIIEDHVTIYSNTSVLGRITIGHHSVLGGNVWQTRDVPPNSLVLQSRAVSSIFTDGAGI